MVRTRRGPGGAFEIQGNGEGGGNLRQEGSREFRADWQAGSKGEMGAHSLAHSLAHSISLHMALHPVTPQTPKFIPEHSSDCMVTAQALWRAGIRAPGPEAKEENLWPHCWGFWEHQVLVKVVEMELNVHIRWGWHRLAEGTEQRGWADELAASVPDVPSWEEDRPLGTPSPTRAHSAVLAKDSGPVP